MRSDVGRELTVGREGMWVMQVIGINAEFPGPLIDVSTNDVVEVNVFNHLDEPLLFTW